MFADDTVMWSEQRKERERGGGSTQSSLLDTNSTIYFWIGLIYIFVFDGQSIL